jgi:tetratricopeptide (TPR) repeat protein
MASMSLQAAYDQARQWLESNDLDQAVGLAQHILDHYPDNLEAYRILGEAHLANRQLDRAQESFERVLRSDPENIPAHVGLGITSERQGQIDRAVAEFEQALEIKPDMAELRSQLLRLYTEGWGSENAQLRLSRAGLARLYAKGHMLPQAISEFRQVIADQPGRFDTMVALAETLWRDGQEDDAMALCRSILAQRPESLKANLLLGYLLMTAGDPSGERYWQAAARMDPYYGVARALFETLPPSSDEQPTIEEWDVDAWRSRRAAEQQEQIAATRPMEAITPIGTAVAATTLIERPRARPAPATPFAGGDDFLASLLAIETPALPPTPPVAELSDDDLGLNIDMAPFSFEDPSVEPQAAASPAAPATNDVDEPAMTPFSLADLGLSEDEIAGMDSLGAPAATPSAEPDEPAMTPFSLADLGLSEDEIAGMDSLSTPAATPSAEPDEPAMTPFSLADLGLSEDEIAGMDSLNALDATPTPSAEPDEPAMTPFSLADLGLSEDEIAGMDSLNALDTRPAVELPSSSEEDDDIKISPFSLSDLGLSDDEIADMDSLQTNTRSGLPPAQSTPNTSGDIPDMNDLPIDLMPFSIDELDLGASDTSNTGVGELPPSLQPFSLDESPPQRPRVSSFVSPESTDNENISDEDDFAPETRGYSWQQASQKPETSFSKTPREEPSSDASIFSKLKQHHLNNPDEHEPPPLAPMPIEPDEHLGLFSLDDISLRDDSPLSLPETEAPAVLETPVPTMPPVPEESRRNVAPVIEIDNLEDAVASGQIQPFSLADLGLSPEEIAAMGMGDTPAEPEPPSAPPTAAGVVIDHVEFDPAGRDYTGEFVLIKNTATTSVDLTRWTLRDAGGKHKFVFPPFLLGATDLVRLWTRRGINDRANLYWDSTGAIWNNSGDTAILQDASGKQVSSYSFGPPPSAPAAPEPSVPTIPTPAPEIDNLEDAVAAGQVQPFSLADLGLSEEEIAALGLGEPAATEAPATPASEIDNLEDAVAAGQVQPFSLADLGLSEEEIAALDLGEATTEAPTTPTPEIDNLEDAVAAGQVQPFSLADLGLSEEEIAALGLGEATAPEAPAHDPIELETPAVDDTTELPTPTDTTPTEATRPSADTAEESTLLTSDLKPFSLTDLGLSDDEISELGLDLPTNTDRDEGMGLDLTEEELEGLDGGDLNWATQQAEPIAPASNHMQPQLTTGDLVVDRLIALGRQQGYVDIADIMADFEDPEAEAARIEEIGQLLHDAQIEIRDGDEVIDMDADYEEDQAEAETTESTDEWMAAPDIPPPAAPTYPTRDLDLATDDGDQFGLAGAAATAPDTSDEPDMTPFSLSDLGLSDDEINALGLDEPTAPAAPAEPALTPFSLSDLGLSEEEIASLGLDEPATPAEPPAPAEPESTPFSLSDLGLAEDQINVPELDEPAAAPEEPQRMEETPAPAEPELTPFSLSELGLSEDEIAAFDLGEATTTSVPEPAADEPVLAELEPDQASPAQPEPAQTAPIAVPTPIPVATPPPVAVPTPPPVAPPPTRAPARATGAADNEAPIFTGNDIVDEFLHQLKADPQNDVLRISLARIGWQIGIPDLAVQQYKYMIKHNRSLDQVVDEINDLLSDSDEQKLMQRLHRTLGDAYTKQGRFREAIEEYSWTHGGPRGARS